VTAAGGTTLAASASGALSLRGFNESAWSLSGGWGGGSGCDVHVSKPSYQTDTGCTGRSYSDVSADANPSTGLIVRDSGNGGWLLVGGTSLSTPLVAGYEAVTGVGSTPQWAYSDSALLNDPTTGSTGSCAANIAYICNARAGYDGPTGAGSISGDVVPGGPGIGGPGVSSGSGNTYTQSVTSGGATLAGGVYPNGLATSYWWQYGPTTAYGQQTTATSIGAGHGPVVTTASLTGLAAATTYHYRLVAQNSAGTTYGYDYALTTGSLAPSGTAAPAISGTPRASLPLTATTGSWNPAGTYTYQWQRATSTTSGWSNLVSATGSSYTPVGGDAGASLRVAVTATNSYGHATAYSASVGPITVSAPIATVAPAISGSPSVGQALTASTGAWSPAGTYSYQWQRATSATSGWSNILAASGSSYTPVAGDAGAGLRVGVTATNNYGHNTAYSGSAGPVAAAALTALSPATITGIARPGQTLTSTTGTWNSSGTYSYQWQYAATATSGWSNITGATSATYTLPGADVHAIVRLNVTLTNNSSRGTAYSGAIGPVTTSATTVSRGAIFALASLDRWLRG
jgi:hypothetical protein